LPLQKKGQTNPGAQEIIVESPGPVVNRLPVWPRETKKQKAAQALAARTHR